MRISDWSSDVCSSDLEGGHFSTRVIPAKAGTQFGISRRPLWFPAFAGMTKSGDNPQHRPRPKPPALFLGPYQDHLADQREQNERPPRGEEGRVGAEVAHREREIVGDEIGEAQRHS